MDNQEKLLAAKELATSEPDAAVRILNEVLNDDFDGVDGQMALFMIAFVMMECEKYGLAYHLYNRCAQLSPNVSEIYSNMGMCLENDPHKAIRMFQKASQLNPDNARAYANEALTHLQTGRPDKCIELSEKALSIEPDLSSARHNLGLAQLMSRQWVKGWTNYFETLGVKHRERRDYGLPDWNGESGTVVVYGEQGVGDEIMFASCLNELTESSTVILDSDSRLEGLFRRSFPKIKVYGTRFHKQTPLLDENKPDYQCAIGQLPYFYRQLEDRFTGEPYLTPDPERCLQWRALFETFKGRKIGIAWSGGLPNTGAHKRTLSLDDFTPLFNDSDTFISLEYKPVDQSELDKYGVKSYPRATAKGGDIDDLAALINELDVVVTACTTVVYVAGALGIPCIVLVPREPGYRYHISGDFPWYNSVKLIRQKNDWRQCVVEAVKCLESL